MSLPILLAVSGTVLMALAIFIPIRQSLTAPAEAEGEFDDDVQAWPELVEPRAAGCDAAARLDLVDALASLRSAWAIDVLTQARELETDPAVREAIAIALDAQPSETPA